MIEYDALVDFVHRTGVESTEYLQQSFAWLCDFFVWISVVFDPTYTYTLYFPLLYHANRATGLQILFGSAISEWLNHVFKWILFGERPYWWVHENTRVWENMNMTIPHLQQTPITCETGPGSPSGHVMVNATVGFIFVEGILRITNSKCLRNLAWTAYFVCLILIAISRVYIAAHFPHQCFCGLLSGICLGYFLSKQPVINMRLLHLVLLIGVMALLALGIYNLILYLGVDPGWTVPLAKKWCWRPDWVHLSSTLFYMFWRYMGTMVGIVFSLKTSAHRRKRPARYGFVSVVVLAIMSELAVKSIALFIFKEGTESVVYMSAFAVHIILPYVVMEAMPWAMDQVLWSLGRNTHID